MEIGVIGAGTMGSGIAQVAAQSGHKVWLFDTNEAALEKATKALAKIMARLVEKGRLSEADAQGIKERINCGERLPIIPKLWVCH